VLTYFYPSRYREAGCLPRFAQRNFGSRPTDISALWRYSIRPMVTSSRPSASRTRLRRLIISSRNKPEHAEDFPHLGIHFVETRSAGALRLARRAARFLRPVQRICAAPMGFG
jgi:hypothetical protein